MLEVGIQNLVAANPAVQAIIGNPARFYPVTLPENPVYPCATYQVISDQASYTLDGVPNIDTIRIQVDTWSGGSASASYLDAKNAQAAIRAVLDLFHGTLSEGTVVAAIFVANAVDLFEQDARAYRTTTDYLVNYYSAT